MRRFGLIVGAGALAIVLLFGLWVLSRPERGMTGSVSTRFHLLGPNDKIVVDGFDDPKVEGVACHISRAQTGGLKGGLGVAEDTSDAGIACRQVGPIKITGELKDGFSMNAAVSSSRRCKSSGFSIASATCWYTWPIATASSRAA